MTTRVTGVPRNSPAPDQPLVPLSSSSPGNSNHHQHHHNSPIPGSPGGILDLSKISKVAGTNRAGMFVSTAVTGEGSHLQNATMSSSSPSSYLSGTHSSSGRKLNPQELSARRRREKYEHQQKLLQERSPVVSTAVNVKNDPELQMRFAASIMPSGTRGVQPLPDFLDSSFGFQATIDSKTPPPMPAAESLTSSPQSQSQQQNYLSTTTNFSSHHQHHNHPLDLQSPVAQEVSFASSNDNNNNVPAAAAATTPSPIPTNSNTTHNNHGNIKSSSKYLFSPSTSRRQGITVHNAGGRTSSRNRTTSTMNNRNNNSNNTSSRRKTTSTSTMNGSGLGGKANRVVCCPEEHATTGHLAKGIVIGTCERQAMEQYLQVSRELELEREARATDKWKAELELVKALNKSQDLEKQVEKLTEIAENPRPLHEARLLRQEYETRWRAAQSRVEELEAQKARDGREEEELRLKLMQKEHECEGLKAAVKRMETSDKNHDDELADWRKKWYDQKAEKERQMGIVADLEKQISRLHYENKSLRGAIRGLEQRLIIGSRKDKLNNKNSSRSPVPSSSNSLFAAGSPANAITLQQHQGGSARSKSTGRSGHHADSSGQQLNDLDAAVRVLMHAYSSPGQSPLQLRPTLDSARGVRSSSHPPPPLSASQKQQPRVGKNVLAHMDASAEKKKASRSTSVVSSGRDRNPLDDVMIKTSARIESHHTTNSVAENNTDDQNNRSTPTRKL